jgi:hypothetical protein
VIVAAWYSMSGPGGPALIVLGVVVAALVKR